MGGGAAMNQLPDLRADPQPWTAPPPAWTVLDPPQPAPIIVHEHHNAALPILAIVGIVAVAIVAIVALFLASDFGTLALGAGAATLAWWGAWLIWQLTAGRQ
jgi:hypothetical protein